MSHWKWRETKLQPRRARSGHQISCCLVSLHFLCDIQATITSVFVYLTKDEIVETIAVKSHDITEQPSRSTGARGTASGWPGGRRGCPRSTRASSPRWAGWWCGTLSSSSFTSGSRSGGGPCRLPGNQSPEEPKLGQNKTAVSSSLIFWLLYSWFASRERIKIGWTTIWKTKNWRLMPVTGRLAGNFLFVLTAFWLLW